MKIAFNQEDIGKVLARHVAQLQGYKNGETYDFHFRWRSGPDFLDATIELVRVENDTISKSNT